MRLIKIDKGIPHEVVANDNIICTGQIHVFDHLTACKEITDIKGYCWC